VDIYTQRTVNNIKMMKRPSGKIVNKIILTEQLMSKYQTNDPLTICYMIAKQIDSIPICLVCNKNKLKLLSTKDGFSKFCSRECHSVFLSGYNRNNNKQKNLTKSEKLKESREKKLHEAAQYYKNNDIRIFDLVDKFNLPYACIRQYLSEKKLVKNDNAVKFRKKIFATTVDERLFDEEFLKDCSDNKKYPLTVVGDILGVSPNTVRIYSLKKGIKFDNYGSTERSILDFVKQYDSAAEKTRKIIRPYEIDIFSSKYNLGIELNGEYWHNEDRLDIRYHLNKQKCAESNNIKLIQIFLHEWSNKRNIIESMILSNMNLTKRVFARKLRFVNLDKNIARSFFESNHLQGWIKCQSAYGLLDENDEVISAITFGKSRYDKQCELELLRYCNKLNHTVIGGFTKLMTNAQKLLNFSSVVTYSHRRLFTGNVYEKFGFKKVRETRPGYFWFNLKTKDILKRYSTQKHKLNTTMSEIDHMKNLGYRRVFDCGQNVYKYFV
jgi:hypothetical protein